MEKAPHTEGLHTDYPHRGITMHRIFVGGNFPGILFAVGSVLIFLFAVPALWVVIGGALVVVVAALLQIVHQTHPADTPHIF